MLKILNKILITTLILFNIADLFCTYYLIRTPELEGNPFMKYLWNTYGFGMLIAVKIALTSLVIYIAYWLFKNNHQRHLLFALGVTNGAMLYVMYLFYLLWTIL